MENCDKTCLFSLENCFSHRIFHVIVMQLFYCSFVFPKISGEQILSGPCSLEAKPENVNLLHHETS